jgi:hypothetical protein
MTIERLVKLNDGSRVIDFHTDWYCPECNEQAQSTNTVVNGEKLRQMPLHYCPGLHGLLAPMVKAGVTARLRVNYREDYTNGDLVTTDSRGKVVMGITTQRNDGEDLIVHSPCAVLNLGRN